MSKQELRSSEKAAKLRFFANDVTRTNWANQLRTQKKLPSAKPAGSSFSCFL